jgi:hypothetical protein
MEVNIEMNEQYNVSLAYDYNAGQTLKDTELAQFITNFKATATDEKLREAFAASLAIPVLRAIPPQTSVRNIFAVDNIPAGALAEYPIDMQNIRDAIVMPHLGAIPQNLVVGDSLIVPTFEVANSVEWKLTFVRDGRYNIVERALTKLAEAFVRQEEQAGWDVIKASCDGTNTITLGGSVLTLDKNVFNDFITDMTKTGYVPTDIYVSPNRAKDIRNWTYTQLDPWTQKEIFQAGGLSSIWNVRLNELRTLGDKEVYIFDTSRFGVMPIRASMTTFDDPTAIKRLRAGVMAWQEIGFSAIDKSAVRKLAFA